MSADAMSSHVSVLDRWNSQVSHLDNDLRIYTKPIQMILTREVLLFRYTVYHILFGESEKPAVLGLKLFLTPLD